MLRTQSLTPAFAGLSILLFAGIPILVLAPDRIQLVWLAVLALSIAPIAHREIVFAALIIAVRGQPPFAVGCVALFALSILEQLSAATAVASLLRFSAYALLAAEFEPPGELAIAIVIGSMAVRKLSARQS